jgi:hypothetical protein
MRKNSSWFVPNTFVSGCHIRSVNHGMLNSIYEIWRKWDHPQRSSLYNHKEGLMRAKSVFTMGFLSMIAAVGLFGASNGFADPRDHVKGQRSTTGSDDLNISGGRASRLQVVDSEGNVYLLIPLKTKHGKATVEYVVPYTMPTSH